jgi:hypothetical protein
MLTEELSMSDAFVLSLPWGPNERREINILISERRKISFLTFICFLALCFSSYVATSCDVDYVTSSDQALFEKASSPSNEVDNQNSITHKESIIMSFIKDNSMIINCVVLVFGVIVMIYFMIRLKATDKELEYRMEQAFASNWTRFYPSDNVVNGTSSDLPEEVPVRRPLQTFLLTQSGWLVRNNDMSLRRANRPDISVDVSGRTSQKWARMLVHGAPNVQLSSTRESVHKALFYPMNDYGSLDDSTALKECSTISSINAACCRSDSNMVECLGDVCSICLSAFEDGDFVVCLPCCHIYHDQCLTPWISLCARCPLCRCNLEEMGN